MGRPKIAFISEQDPRDKRSWSGTQHFMWQALQQHIGDVTLLGPYTPQPLKFFCSAFNYLTLRLLGKRFDYRHSNLMRRAYGKHFTRLLAKEKFDCVFVSASISTAAGLRSTAPVIYLNDRVISGAMNYHKVLTQLFGFSKRQSLANDRAAIENSALAVFCSDWAAGAAKEIAGAAAGKVKMVPFGANLEKLPALPGQMDFPAEPVRLLFVGVNWNDKGGVKAYDALLALLKAGVNAELSIVGCTPPPEYRHANMKLYGFLDKNSPADFERLTELFRTHHFFILPTKYEAYGLVFCEAAAYGLPALAPRTGGIPTIIDDGQTGFLLAESATGADYAEKMLQLVHQPEAWQQMRAAAYEKFCAQLNWDAWARTIKEELLERNFIR